jgi:hypothetical protein
VEVGRELGRFQKATAWAFSDWFAFGEHKYGERKAIIESEDWIGPSYQSCKMAAVVCRAFEQRLRRLNLSFGHHYEVASIKDEALRESLLDWCEGPVKNGVGKAKSIRALREELERRGVRPVKSAVSNPVDEESEETVTHLEPRSGQYTDSRAITLPLADTLLHMGTCYVHGACKEIDDRAADEDERRSVIAILLGDLDRLRGEVHDHFYPKAEWREQAQPTNHLIG